MRTITASIRGVGLVSASLLLACTAVRSNAADWRMYRHDLRRSAITEDRLAAEVSLHWIYEPHHRPKPAWPLPGEETPRMHTDRAFHVVADAERAFFGSSIDHQIYAVDSKTGSVRWTFYTEGPVRFAPVLDAGRLYAGSDDGWVYCLGASGGELIWKYRPGPTDEHVIGNGRMVSSWPVRTGLLVEKGIVYVAAGVFPYEGLYICGLDADSGKELWKNDTAGDRAWGLDYGGIAPQGYLLASESTLYVPSGRSMPASFERGTGKFIRFLASGGKTGGSWALLDEDQLIAGVNSQGDAAKIAYEDGTGKRKGDIFSTIGGIDLVQTPETSFTLTEEGVYAVDRENYRKAATGLPELDRKLKELGTESSNLNRDLRELRAEMITLTDQQNEVELAGAKEKRATLLDSLTAVGQKISALQGEKRALERGSARWDYQNTNLTTLILAGDTVIAAGDGVVVGLNAENGDVRWTEAPDGNVLGLAVAHGRLFASTEQGPIYCYGLKRNRQPLRQRQQLASPADELSELAAWIVSQSAVKKGYCLVMNSGAGRLAQSLALHSGFQIIALERDPAKLSEARTRLNSAGLYGSRVFVEPWDLADLPDYFANLIVDGGLVESGELRGSAEEMFRVLQPFGGVAVLGHEEGVASRTEVRAWLAGGGAPEPVRLPRSGNWWKVTRGKLEGSGSWTGLYGNSANTGSSPDDLVRGPMGVLWYGEPGSDLMVERHARSVSPLAVHGRLFMQGEEVVMAYDGYNGTRLWQRNIPGAIRVRVDVDGGNLSATPDFLYVAAHDKTHKLDALTGETLNTFETPSSVNGDPRRWGYIAATEDQVYGSAAIPLEHDYGWVWDSLVRDGRWIEEQAIPEELQETFRGLKASYAQPDEKAWDYFKRSTLLWRAMAKFPGWGPDHKPSPVEETMKVSDAVYAYDSETGEMTWQRQGKNIPNITITLGGGMMFFVEDELDEARRKAALEEKQALIVDGRFVPHDEENLTYAQKDIRRLVAIDTETGKEAWSRTVDLSGCGGSKLGTAYADGRLLCFGHYSNHDQPVFAAGGLAWRRISVFDTKTGDLIWSKPLNYRRRPLIMGDTIYIEPRACYLATGEIKMREHPATGELVPWEFLRPGHSCGIVTASPHSIFYRSFCAAIVDVEKDSGMSLFGAVRPGCWNNLIPANGVLSFQESSAGCTCSYALRTTVVLKHNKRKEPGEWSVFIANDAMTPVAHLALNLGAPGDMRDEAGQLWFGYPRPDTSVGQGTFRNYGIKFDLKETVLKGMGVMRRDFRGVTIEDSTRPWLFTSGVKGMTKCTVPLLDGQPPATYTVRLGFVAAADEAAGQRVFDIRLQGQTVLMNFDAAQAAGRANRAVVKEFKGIRVTDNLSVELIPANPAPSEREAPVIHTLELIMEEQEKTASAQK